jgi:hypothetical protein
MLGVWSHSVALQIAILSYLIQAYSFDSVDDAYDAYVAY